jgi:hypothetical protein
MPISRNDWPTMKRAFEENDVVSGHLDRDNNLRVWNTIWETKQALIEWVSRDDVKKEELYELKALIDARDTLSGSEVQARAEQESIVISRILEVSQSVSRNIWEVVSEVGRLSDTDIESVIFWLHNEGVENILLSDSIIYWVDIIGDNDPVLYPMYLKFSQLYPELYVYSEIWEEKRRDVIIGIMAHAIINNSTILIDFSWEGENLSNSEVIDELETLSNEELRVTWAWILNNL